VTSIVVSYDAHEALKIVDYVYFLADGMIAAEGATEAVKVSTDPFVHQFIRGQPDGPVPFHYPTGAYAEDMGMSARV
jgi:phospholipid/cholesterol/gamma-HCH transport system ATP-binding protein